MFHFHASQNSNIQQTSNLKFLNYIAALTLSCATCLIASSFADSFPWSQKSSHL